MLEGNLFSDYLRNLSFSLRKIYCILISITNGGCISISIEDRPLKSLELDNKISSASVKLTNKADNIRIESSSSSDDSENEKDRRATSPLISQQKQQPQHQHQESNSDDSGDNQQSTMWLGTEDGCIHVYNCTDNIRIKKNKIKIQHVSAVYSIL